MATNNQSKRARVEDLIHASIYPITDFDIRLLLSIEEKYYPVTVLQKSIKLGQLHKLKGVWHIGPHPNMFPGVDIDSVHKGK